MCRAHLKAKLLHHIWFAKMILKNLINEAMFDEPKLVLVSQEDIELINKLCKRSRPSTFTYPNSIRYQTQPIT